ncbi:MAG TPA: FG-GAP-like repeat-containing protein [Chloroflexia bacterium]|nr:FG-GAP-like repeat-containing protein [Chloroflexia bacterium]
MIPRRMLTTFLMMLGLMMLLAGQSPTGSMAFGSINIDSPQATRNLYASVSGGACPTPSFGPPTNYAVGQSPSFAATADFNHDDNLDLVSANNTDISVLLGNGLGGFGTATNFATGDGSNSIAIGDFNHDDNLDVATANASDFPENVSVLLGNGTGGFSPATNYTAGTTAYSVDTGDFNHDNNLDLVVANFNTADVSIFLGNGTGGFSAPTNFPAGTRPAWVSVGEFNGDTHLDLAVADINTPAVMVLLGNGTGGFSAPTGYATDTELASVEVADVNHDMIQDLVTANSFARSLSILLGNGDGTFDAATNVTMPGFPLTVSVSDLNLDGDPDLAVAQQNPSSLEVLLGDGAGGFSAPVSFQAGTFPRSVAFGDYNRDGGLDMATANSGSNNVSVLLNNCHPEATATPSATASATASSTSTSTATATITPTTVAATPTVEATATPCTISFGDVPVGSTFYPFVECLACRGIISGYGDGTFHPGNEITRGQIAKMVSNSANINDDPGPQMFEDVDITNTFYTWINRLANRGYMGGYPCGGEGEPCGGDNRPYFRPFSNATRGQLAKIVSNAAGIGGTPTGQFYADVLEDHPFYVWIMRLTGLGVMSGYPCGGEGEPCDEDNRPYFRPFSNVTRGQASKIVANTFFPNCESR